MNKTIIVSIAILGLSTSAALAAKAHHAKKPAASTAMNPSGPTNRRRSVLRGLRWALAQ